MKTYEIEAYYEIEDWGGVVHDEVINLIHLLGTLELVDDNYQNYRTGTTKLYHWNVPTQNVAIADNVYAILINTECIY